MPDDLKTIVQRMIDAGESEANIATVIQHYAPPAPTPQPEGFVARSVAAIGPAVRGLGDIGVPFTNLDINQGLEATGLVPEGRLTGPEASARDQATRTVSGLAGGTVVTSGLLSRAVKAIQASRAAAAAEQAATAAKKLEDATQAARAAKTARFLETGIIDASPDVVVAPQASTAAPAITSTAVREAAKLLIKAGLFGAGAKTVARYLD